MITKEFFEKLQNLVESQKLDLNSESYLRDSNYRYIPIEDIVIDSDGGLLITSMYDFGD